MLDDSEAESAGSAEVVNPRELAKEYSETLMRHVLDPPQQLESFVQQRREYLEQNADEPAPNYSEFLAEEEEARIARHERAEARRNEMQEIHGKGGGSIRGQEQERPRPRARPTYKKFISDITLPSRAVFERYVQKFVEKWALNEGTLNKMLGKTQPEWDPRIVMVMCDEFAPRDPLFPGGSWDGRIHNMWKAKREEMASEPSLEERAALEEQQEAWEARVDMEEDASDSEIGPRPDSFFDVPSKLLVAFRDWRELGPRPAVLRDFSVALRKEERRLLLLYLQLEESKDLGLVRQSFGPVAELEAYRAYMETKIGEVETREGWGLEVRYPYAERRGERAEEERERFDNVVAIADLHKMTIEQAQQYLRRSARDSLLPLTDWKLGLEGAGRLPSIYFGSWSAREVVAGGPDLTEEARVLFEAPHPSYHGKWGQLRAQFMALFPKEGATEGWMRGMPLEGLTERERRMMNDFRVEERDRVRLAMLEPLPLRQQPGHAERVHLAAWYCHALIIVTRFSGGELVHPNINGALADIQRGRVHVREEDHLLLRAQRMRYAERVEEGIVTWGRGTVLLREEPEGEHAWPHEEGDVEMRRVDQAWGVRRNTPEDDRRREQELQERRIEEEQRDEQQQQAARQATAKAKGAEKGTAKRVDARGKTWTGEHAMPVGGWGQAGKPDEKKGKGDPQGSGKEGKKGDGKDGKKGEAKSDMPKGKGKEPAAKDARGKLVTNVAASVVMPTQEKGKATGKAEEIRQEMPGEKGEAKAKGQGEPEPAPQKPQAQQDQWRTHWEREEEKQSRGEWGTAGAQQQSWQDKWNASQRNDRQDEGNDQQAEWRGKYRNW